MKPLFMILAGIVFWMMEAGMFLISNAMQLTFAWSAVGVIGTAVLWSFSMAFLVFPNAPETIAHYGMALTYGDPEQENYE